jgi:hypothetical protein
MRFWIEGEPFAFGPSAFILSKLLSECQSAAEIDNEAPERIVQLPLKRRWVEAWDAEEGLSRLPLEARLGAAKVCV